MESSYWLLIVAINLLFATHVSCVKRSKLEAKVDALDSVIRGELYLLKETIETDRQERKELVKKLNETLEYLEIATGDRVDKPQVDTNNDGIQKELNALSEKMEQNSNAVSQMAESQLRTKRGLIEEKKARKADAAAVVTELIQIQRTLNDLSSTQQDIIKNQNEIVKNQNKIVNYVTGMRNEIITNQDDQIDNINVIVTKTDALQDITADLRGNCDILKQTLKDELSRATETVNKTTQQLVFQVTDIALATEEVKAAVAPKLYCNSQLDLDACLQKHFETVQQMLGPVRLVGGTNQYEGRVEVNYQGRRGTVCDDNWDNKDAKVVCRMLGYTGGTALQGPGDSAGHSFGEGSGEILLDDVACTGGEKSLFACNHDGIGAHNCGHNEDAGVRCDP